MPEKLGNEYPKIDRGAQSVLQSTAYSEPWWKGAGTDPLGEAASKSKSPSLELLNCSMASGTVHSKAHGGMCNGGNSCRQNLISVLDFSF